MRVAPPPVRQRSPDPPDQPDPPGDAARHLPPNAAGNLQPDAAGHLPPDAAGHLHAPDDPVAWDHFVVEVTDACAPVVVRCRGGLDFAYADQLREVLTGIAERHVVVDLRRLTFVDSTGMSALLTARRALQDAGGTMSIRAASGLVRHVFKAAELEDVLDD